ncbi:arsenic resistance permease [Campylobacter sp. RM5004]|uniref:permease n=1 Tax=Campylobacter sp. RM5004 TaxID=1660078 RepID=UPI001EFA9373|nr:permease [Campylobacter sp. RM5004]ULO02100.1 arsenic resistance permease [Campylobacter sp. RM5004]
MEFSSEKLLSFFYEFLFLMCEITLLFIIINMIMAYINARFDLGKYLKNNVFSYLKAIFIGSLTPFCSCSTIPLFNSLLKNGINHGISFAYLLTSPLINPMIFTMLLAAFGLKIAIFYVIFIVVFVLIISLILGQMNPKSLLKDEFIKPKNVFFTKNHSQKTSILNQNTPCKCTTQQKLTLKDSFVKAVFGYIKVFKYIFLGMLVGAFFHNFIPQDLLSNYLANFGIFGIFLASLLGILLYVRTDLIIPLGVSLMNAGFPLGVLFSFLIAGGGCSLPELILLKSMFKTRMMIIFILSVLAMANVFGVLLYLFY